MMMMMRSTSSLPCSSSTATCVMMIYSMLFSLCMQCIYGFQPSNMQNVIPMNEGSGGGRGSPWWKDSSAGGGPPLKFDCTGCGKCCRVSGEVILNKEQSQNIANHLEVTLDEFASFYTKGQPVEGWARLRERVNPLGHKTCIFLGDDEKTCGIYEARPLQCRTFPFWPRILDTPASWAREAVVKDDEEGKHWTKEAGGCEGISDDAPAVDPAVVEQNSEMYAAFMRRVPDALSAQLLATIQQEKRVIDTTRAWVREFVIGLSLCPFADAVFSTSKVKYSVRELDKESSWLEAYEIFTEEARVLLAEPEDKVATTILVIPNSFPDFEDFYAFSLWLEETVEEDEEFGDAILPVTFHPNHLYAELPEDDSLHFEKRAPYPCINLLRAAKVDEYIAMGKTQDIGINNEKRLTQEGYAAVKMLWDQMMMGLDL